MSKKLLNILAEQLGGTVDRSTDPPVIRVGPPAPEKKGNPVKRAAEAIREERARAQTQKTKLARDYWKGKEDGLSFALGALSDAQPARDQVISSRELEDRAAEIITEKFHTEGKHARAWAWGIKVQNGELFLRVIWKPEGAQGEWEVILDPIK